MYFDCEAVLKKNMMMLLTEMYKNRNVAATMSFFSKQAASLSGMNVAEKLTGYEEIEQWLSAFLPQLPEYELQEPNFQVLLVQENECMVCGSIVLKRNGKLQKHHISGLWQRKTKWRLYALHISPSESAQKELSDMVSRQVYNSYQQLGEKYREKSIQLEMLLKTCNGGLAVMEDDKELHFLYINEGMHQMLGYTKEEFLQKCNGCLQGTQKENQQKAMWEIHWQLEKKASFEYEYKTRHKSGKDVWIYTTGRYGKDSNGKQQVYAIYVDITERKNALVQLEVEHIHNQIILEMSGDTILEYNTEKDEILFRQYCVDGEPKTYQIANFRQKLPQLLKEYVLEEDCTKVLAFITARLPEGTIEFRGLGEDGQRWYCLTLRTLTIEYGKSYELIGRIHNIDRQKYLENEANLDGLTGLYNRRFMLEEMKKAMKKESGGALVMMDIDHFKQVNDNFGHDVGDKVLVLLANLLGQSFRKDDLVCRVGGDEFLVFMRAVTSKEIVENRCTKLMKVFEEQTQAYHSKVVPSLSIGAVMITKESTTDELYCLADELLYEVKRNGKNAVCVKKQTEIH